MKYKWKNGGNMALKPVETRWCTRAQALVLTLVATACADDGDSIADQTATSGEETSDVEPTDLPTDTGSESSLRCDYVNPFSQGLECRDYLGAGWTQEDAQTDCDGFMGALATSDACAADSSLGVCTIGEGTEREVWITAYGDDPASCSEVQIGCETFGGGQFEPEGICADDTGPDDGVENPFIPPTLECRPPLEGEPQGSSPDGEVCTWQTLAGATEEGRRFSDYAQCDAVLTQRPYYPAPPHDLTDDPRIDDPVYRSELDWAQSQIEATGCICCHSNDAPAGAAGWTTDAMGNWVGTFDDRTLAFAGGWIDSVALGAYEPENNNGFSREFGFPSTDPERLRRFFLDELEFRGLSRGDFQDAPPIGDALYDQMIYEPVACESEERVDRDGSVHWEGGAARYIFVLEAGAENPTVPPNLDLPDGTIWRIDVPWDESAVFRSGEVEYQQVPRFASQRFPSSGAPSELIEGRQYYLNVQADVSIPITRCLFTY